MSRSMATKIFGYIEPLFNRRSVVFLFCLIISALFWLLTTLSGQFEHTVRIPVAYSGIPESLIIVNQPVEWVNAKTKGFGFDLLWYWFSLESADINVVADPAHLPSLKRNGRSYHYILTNRHGEGMVNVKDDQLEILDIEPDTLFLIFRPKVTKLVPVKLNADITFLKQFGATGEPVLEPDSILIFGPKEEIDPIRFLITEHHEWTELDQSLTSEVRLLKQPNGSFVKYGQGAVNVEINVVEFTEGTVTVPVRVLGRNSESVRVFPKEVSVKYQVPLSAYDQVLADQFLVSVTLNEESKDQSRLVVSIDRQPDNVRQVRVTPAQVEFIVQR